jgi:uncharacterized membrane protein
VSNRGDDDDTGDRRLARRSDDFEVADAEIVGDRKEIAAEVDGKPLAVATQTSLQLKTSYFSGPLPRPEIFEAYERICPGAADRILRMSEKEGDHRRALEVKQADNDTAIARRAQVFGFACYIVTTLGGGALLLLGVPALGIAMVIGSLVTLLGAGIYNKYEERKLRELEERQVAAVEAVANATNAPKKKPEPKKPDKKKKR